MLFIRAVLLWVILCGTVFAEIVIPDISHRVTDQTATLNPEQVRALETRLSDFAKQKGSQIVVYIVPTTGDETIEQFGIRAAEIWKVGRKGVDDGVLMIVAKKDHKLRIEVGYGLEGTLNDATSKHIISDTILPYFKHDDFYHGIDAGVTEIIKSITAEKIPMKPTSAPSTYTTIAAAGILFGFIIFVFSFLLGGILGHTARGVAVGSMLLWSSIFLAVAIGLTTFLFSKLVARYFGKNTSETNIGNNAPRSRNRNYASSGTNNTGYLLDTGTPSGGASSVDSFSGAGGTFGGGGASSSWSDSNSDSNSGDGGDGGDGGN